MVHPEAMWRRTLIGSMLLVLSTTAGCFEIKGAKVKALIVAQLDSVGATATVITCPDKPVEKGATFTCDVEVDGVSFEVEGKQLDDKGSVGLDPILHVLNTKLVVTSVEGMAQAQGRKLSLQCADSYWVHVAGAQHECAIDGDSAHVLIELTETPGQYVWKLAT